MGDILSADLRNVAVVGHGGTGKTSLVSACLYVAGAVNRLGRVTQGTAVTDYDPEEIDRQISIQAALGHCRWDGAHITFIDTPGYDVFRADTRAAARIADGVVVVVDAVAGAEVMTEKVWEYAQRYRNPALFVINRLDRERGSFERVLASLKEAFGREVVPLQIPIGAEEGFCGVIDLVELKAYRYERDGDGRASGGEVPEELREAAGSQRESLVEMVAEGSEELMEAFFEAGDLSQEELLEGLRQAVWNRSLFPVVCASSLYNLGTDRVLDAVVRYLPPPTVRGEVQGKVPGGEGEASRPVRPDAPFSALVFKTLADPYAGRITLMKVLSGTAKADAAVLNPRTGATERLANLSLVQGKRYEPVPEVVAGQLCAVAKLRDTHTGDTLCDRSDPIVYELVGFPEPAISFAVEPESKADEEKISQALARLTEEDPTLRVERDPQTHELLVSGLGQLHVEVAVAKLEKRFGVKTRLKTPKVPYRETIRRSARAEGKHKKQTGGRGQYGICMIEISPLPRGTGFEFEDKIFGGAIPQQFRPAVEKGVVEAAAKGVLAGYPVVDFKTTLVDGKYHPVDSSEIAFKIAGSLAFKAAAEQADPILLEPIMNVEITVPDESTGDVMADLNGRRGRVQGMEPRGNRQVIRAQVPLAELLSYAPDLNSLTGGRGTYHMEFAHYDEVPGHVAQRIIEGARRAQETRA